MSDVTTFIDTIGQDVNATVVPKIHDLAAEIREKAQTTYGPRISAFADQLVKDIIEEQSGAVREWAAAVIQELFQRYRPEIAGELRTKIMQGRVELTGQGVRLDLKRRDTGAPVASLDIPVSVKIQVPDLPMKLHNTTIRLNVVR